MTRITLQSRTESPSSEVASSDVWTSLSQVLPPFRDQESEFWWRLTGRHLAALVEAAGYPVEQQYGALLFHYHWTVPTLGQSPRTDASALKWKSLLGIDGSPLEFSWKWNTRTKEPDIRCVTDPISQFSGTELDPINQLATREILHRLAEQQPGMDVTWANHFFSTLYDHDTSRYTQEAASGVALGTTVQFAVEFLRKGMAFKTYFFGRKVGQPGLLPLDQWEDAIKQVNPTSASRTALLNFIANHPEGKLLKPFSIGVDNVAPSKSRLKWYFHTPHTSFKSVRDILTLGGRIATPHMDQQLEDLHDLIKAIVGLPADFSEDSEVPPGPTFGSSTTDTFGELSSLLCGYLYYFDIAPGNALPDVKIFVPTRYYGPDDLSQAHGIMSWMESRGRGAYCQRYLRMLQALSEHRSLVEGKGLQSYISALFKPNGDLDITTYLGAEAFHPSRLAKRRATRRRGD